jgi:predicted transglutaminase-like cysteine proteinase
MCSMKLRIFILFLLPCLIFSFSASAELFGKSERKSTTLRSFPKWTGVLDKYRQEVDAAVCSDSGSGCALRKWNNFLHSIVNKSPIDQIKEVNKFLNDYPYIQDMVNWGINDYWEVPLEFQAKNGDCEDYSIAKYYSLRALGFPKDSLRVVILQDENLGLLHAVLAVYYNNDIFILDNQSKVALSHNSIYHYTPIYAINEEAWWRYR